MRRSFCYFLHFLQRLHSLQKENFTMRAEVLLNKQCRIQGGQSGRDRNPLMAPIQSDSLVINSGPQRG